MEYLVMSRLDPHVRFPYICEAERGLENPTVFHLRGLTVAEYRMCEEFYSGDTSKVGEFGLKVLEFGLMGWDDFTYDDGEIIPFSLDNLSAIPYFIQLELYNEVINLSEVNDSLYNELVFVTKWGDWLNKHEKSEQWDCDYCADKKLSAKRNCTGDELNTCPGCKEKMHDKICPDCNVKTRRPFTLRFSNVVDDVVTRCPVSMLTTRSIKLTNLINYTDNAKALPFTGGALEQTNFFYTVRSIVLAEQNMLLKREMDNIAKEGKKG